MLVFDVFPSIDESSFRHTIGQDRSSIEVGLVSFSRICRKSTTRGSTTRGYKTNPRVVDPGKIHNAWIQGKSTARGYKTHPRRSDVWGVVSAKMLAECGWDTERWQNQGRSRSKEDPRNIHKKQRGVTANWQIHHIGGLTTEGKTNQGFPP